MRTLKTLIVIEQDITDVKEVSDSILELHEDSVYNFIKDDADDDATVSVSCTIIEGDDK